MMMSQKPALTEEAQKNLLRRCWYSHDARWFTSVAQEFGLEAANRLNRRTVRSLGRAEMLRRARELGGEGVSSLAGLLQLFESGRQLFVPPPLMEFQMKPLDGRSYQVSFQRCFVHENIVRAGIDDGYVCAVFDRLQGWHDALNLPLAQEMPALPCARVQGKECRRVLTVG